MDLILDKYLIKALYAAWKNGRHEDPTVFELFSRNNPFRGEYTIFLGLSNVIKYLEEHKMTEDWLEYLKSDRSQLPHYENKFWDYLASLDTKSVKLYAMNEGTTCFPHEPLIKIIGPFGLVNLLGTAIMSLTGYASLVATNATRFRHATDAINMQHCKLFEFGLRRAQGADAGLQASFSAYIGGFDATSNMKAGKVFGIPTCGTTGHSSIMTGLNNMQCPTKEATNKHTVCLNKLTGKYGYFTLRCLELEEEFLQRIVANKVRFRDVDLGLRKRSELNKLIELAAASPDDFLSLVDTHDVRASGLVNFCIVALALIEFGYKPIGIRIDSGDLAYLSRWAKELFDEVAIEYQRKEFNDLQIMVTNKIDIKVILSLLGQKHCITGFGIGTDVVTCKKQPDHVFVFKMVEIQGAPSEKSSSGKTMIAYSKTSYRLYDKNDEAILDLLLGDSEPVPLAGHPILCRNPFDANQMCTKTPARVEPLLHLWWDHGKLTKKLPSIEAIRAQCSNSLTSLREDIKRFVNPTPYKVSVSAELYDNLSKLKAKPLVAGR